MVLSMDGHEHLGNLFEYTVELVGALGAKLRKPKIDLQKLLGIRATLTMDVNNDPRYQWPASRA
jgi:uncharacterized protein involved in type VI secretion and phage assembly